MHSCLPASCNTPARLALITAVGPPDWPTKRFPTNSDIKFPFPSSVQGFTPQSPQNRTGTLPTGTAAVKEELWLASSRIGEYFADFDRSRSVLLVLVLV